MRNKIIIFLLLFILSINLNQYKNKPVVDNKSILLVMCNDYKRLLISEVDVYISENTRMNSINAEKFVEISLMYDVNIMLMLAQGLAESHFGANGVASRTNNVYNIGNTDNGSKRYFEDIHDGIEEYAKVMKNKYLATKTKDELLNNFVCSKGYRYASAPDYEYKLSHIINNISKSTEINELYNNYKKLNICYYQEQTTNMHPKDLMH